MFVNVKTLVKNKEILAKDGNTYYIMIKRNIYSRLPTRYDCMIYKKGRLFKCLYDEERISYLEYFDEDRIIEIAFNKYLGGNAYESN